MPLISTSLEEKKQSEPKAYTQVLIPIDDAKQVLIDYDKSENILQKKTILNIQQGPFNSFTEKFEENWLAEEIIETNLGTWHATYQDGSITTAKMVKRITHDEYQDYKKTVSQITAPDVTFIYDDNKKIIGRKTVSNFIQTIEKYESNEEDRTEDTYKEDKFRLVEETIQVDNDTWKTTHQDGVIKATHETKVNAQAYQEFKKTLPHIVAGLYGSVFPIENKDNTIKNIRHVDLPKDTPVLKLFERDEKNDVPKPEAKKDATTKKIVMAQDRKSANFSLATLLDWILKFIHNIELRKITTIDEGTPTTSERISENSRRQVTYIQGMPGSGKTHLLTAFAKELVAQEHSVLFLGSNPDQGKHDILSWEVPRNLAYDYILLDDLPLTSKSICINDDGTWSISPVLEKLLAWYDYAGEYHKTLWVASNDNFISLKSYVAAYLDSLKLSQNSRFNGLESKLTKLLACLKDLTKDKHDLVKHPDIKYRQGLANATKDFVRLSDIFKDFIGLNGVYTNNRRPGILVLNAEQFKSLTPIPSDANILLENEQNIPPHQLSILAQQAWNKGQLILYIKNSTKTNEARTSGSLSESTQTDENESQNPEAGSTQSLWSHYENEQHSREELASELNQTSETDSEMSADVFFKESAENTAEINNAAASTPENDETNAPDPINDLIYELTENTEERKQGNLDRLRHMVVTFSSLQKDLREYSTANFLAQLKTRIWDKKDWEFGGYLGASIYTLDGVRPIPKGVRMILNILQGHLSDKEKLEQIKAIAQERKGIRVASVLSLGLFTRSDSTKTFYQSLIEEIEQQEENLKSLGVEKVAVSEQSTSTQLTVK